MLAGRPDPPVSGTAARHCAVTHLSVPLSVSGRQRARGARRPRVPRSGRCQVPHTGRGQTPRRRPEPRGTSTAGPPPLPLFFPLCRAADRPFSNRARNVVRSSVTHSSPAPLSSATLFPTAPRTQTTRLRPPEAPPSLGFRPSAATVHHSPVSSSPSL
jgi:hypothetical protein